VQNTEIPWQSFVQPYGAYVALVMFTLLCLFTGFMVFFLSKWSASSFLTAYVGILIFLVTYFLHWVVFRHDKWAWDADEVDMYTGLEEVMDSEKPLEKRGRQGWKRTFMVIE
jgi:amino acid transporter